jgi:hypothetical protein
MPTLLLLRVIAKRDAELRAFYVVGECTHQRYEYGTTRKRTK